MHKWTKFELDYLRLISWNRSYKDIARMFNDHFKLDISCTAIVGAMKRNNIQTGRTGYFSKGNTPHNKGKKMPPEVYEKAKATMFKKGNIPSNYRPVGSERTTVDGYREIKVADPNKWELKHRYIYEQHYGKISKEDIVIFLDNDKTNLDINNLKCISRKEHLYMNENKFRFEDRDITYTAVNIAKLAIKTREKEKSNVNNRAK